MSTDFKWTDDLVMEFRFHCEYSKGIGFNELLKTFKASKQPKPEWEIIQYRHRPTGALVSDKSHYWGNAEDGDSDYETFSVRRLSDGEVFSLNDKVRYVAGPCNYDYFIICDFFIKKDGGILARDSFQTAEFIQDIAKLKQLLFTTEDGVAYYEGEWKDIYGIHTKDGNNSVGAWAIDGHPQYYEGLRAHYEHLFSTKEKAEEWVQWQKPMFSLQEIKEIGNVDDGNPFFQKLIQKAKDKLNLK